METIKIQKSQIDELQRIKSVYHDIHSKLDELHKLSEKLEKDRISISTQLNDIRTLEKSIINKMNFTGLLSNSFEYLFMGLH